MRGLGLTACLILFALGGSGCQTAHYYRQAIEGQYQILSQRRSIDTLIADPDTPASLKQQFVLVKALRTFAQGELKLPVNKHYVTYVDLHRRYAVWNVHAAPELSLEPKKWWYPFVGSLKYRGFFAEKDAREYGQSLAEDGWDVCVEGVEAYSTLGWFADPLLNTFIGHRGSDLAEIIFHELAHQRLFFSGDTDFNEAFATAVAEEGMRRWFSSQNDEAGYRTYLLEQERNRQFVALVLEARSKLEALYGTNSAPARAEFVRGEKARIIAQLKSDYQTLKAPWQGYAGYDAWFARDLNNAQLNTVSLYYDLVPGFQALLARAGGDLEAFYASVQQMRVLAKDARHSRLRALQQGR